MGLRWIVGAALALGSSAVLGFAACRGAPASGPPPRPSATTTIAPTTAMAMPPPPARPDAGPSQEDQLAAAVASARRCDEPLAAITNQPDGGVIFNNAMTSADAGKIDRGREVLDALSRQAISFRCCVNDWMHHHPDKQGQVMLQLELAPDGSVEHASVDDSRTTIEDDIAIACVVAVARDGSYPPSPRGVPTLVSYPIRVAAIPGAIGVGD